MLKKVVFGSLALSGLFFSSKSDIQCSGIVGIVSKAPITKEQETEVPYKRTTLEKFLCDGVSLYKNSGYDSAGIFRFGPNMKEGKLIKYAHEKMNDLNCIGRVVQEVLAETGIATVGIAHTRNATYGEKTDCNAHPHFDQTGRIYCVHNGSIINHQQIKEKYLKGIKFTSSTDSEVIVQFIAKEIFEGKSMAQALQDFGVVAGKGSTWALVLLDRLQPDMIYTYTSGSPLLIGFSPQEDQIYVVSEKKAFQNCADYYMQTNDGQILELNVNEIEDLKEAFKNRLAPTWEPTQILHKPPPPFKSFFSYQIRQQGEIPFNPDFGSIKKTITFGKYLTMVACGSSYYAAQTTEPMFKFLKCFKKFNVVDHSELEQHDINDSETVVVISQSGETKDIVKIVGGLRERKKINTVGVINTHGSSIAKMVDYPIFMNIGREYSVAPTKSFFHQVLNLTQLATEVAEQKNSASIQVIQEIRQQLKSVPSYVQKVIDDNINNCENLAKILRQKKSIYILGKRESMGIAREAALKIKELNYIHAQAMGAAEMKHGPIALINSEKGHEKETVVFLFILDNETYPYCTSALDQMHSRNAFVVVITDCLHLLEQSHTENVKQYNIWKEHLDKQYQTNVEKAGGDQATLKTLKQSYQKEVDKRAFPVQKYDFALTVPHLKYMSSLLLIIPIQIFAEKMAVLKRINTDFPKNLMSKFSMSE